MRGFALSVALACASVACTHAASAPQLVRGPTLETPRGPLDERIGWRPLFPNREAPFDLHVGASMSAPVDSRDGVAWVLRDADGRIVDRVEVAPRGNRKTPSPGVGASVRVPAHGRYRVELVRHGAVLGASAFAAGWLPCAGGTRRLLVQRDRGARIAGTPATLRIDRWEALDADPAYRVTWTRDGAAVRIDEGREPLLAGAFAKMSLRALTAPWEDAAAVCAFRFGGEAYAAPPLAPGAWEARIDRERQPSLLVRFEVGADGRPRRARGGDEPSAFDVDVARLELPADVEEQLARVPDAAPRAPAARPDVAIRWSAEELRAITRAPRLLELRLTMDGHVERAWCGDEPCGVGWPHSTKAVPLDATRFAQHEAALVRTMRAQIDAHAAPWTKDELPY